MSDLDLTPCQPRVAETIMPDMVWEKTLNFLTDPVDILNVGKTCTLFERFLHSKMTAINFGKTFPILMNYMGNKDVLNCRLVSKGWRDVVDNFFENYFLGRSIFKREGGLAAFKVAHLRFSALYYFSNEPRWSHTDLEGFMATMRDHPRNPFIGRAVYFQLEPLETADLMEDFRTFYDFFEIFGEHIWTLHLYIHAVPFGQDVHLRVNREFIGLLRSFILRDVFVLAPNLKSFKIQADMDLPGTMNDVDELNALASPPALEKIEICAYPALKNAVLRRHSNTQLKTLCKALRANPMNCFHAESGLSWSNLREFHISISLVDSTEIELNGVYLSAPQLELLDFGILTYYHGHNGDYGPTVRTKLIAVLTALRNLATTSPNLKTLHFHIDWFKGERQLAWKLGWKMGWLPGLELPEDLQCPESIKTLHISEEGVDCFYEIIDYSFLLQFLHIENIHIEKCQDSHFSPQKLEEMSKKREIVEVHKFVHSGRMYESNIWKLLPSLNVFSFGKRVYTRSSYERRLPRLENLKI